MDQNEAAAIKSMSSKKNPPNARLWLLGKSRRHFLPRCWPGCIGGIRPRIELPGKRVLRSRGDPWSLAAVFFAAALWVATVLLPATTAAAAETVRAASTRLQLGFD